MPVYCGDSTTHNRIWTFSWQFLAISVKKYSVRGLFQPCLCHLYEALWHWILECLAFHKRKKGKEHTHYGFQLPAQHNRIWTFSWQFLEMYFWWGNCFCGERKCEEYKKNKRNLLLFGGEIQNLGGEISPPKGPEKTLSTWAISTMLVAFVWGIMTLNSGMLGFAQEKEG